MIYMGNLLILLLIHSLHATLLSRLTLTPKHDKIVGYQYNGSLANQLSYVQIKNEVGKYIRIQKCNHATNDPVLIQDEAVQQVVSKYGAKYQLENHFVCQRYTLWFNMVNVHSEVIQKFNKVCLESLVVRLNQIQSGITYQIMDFLKLRIVDTYSIKIYSNSQWQIDAKFAFAKPTFEYFTEQTKDQVQEVQSVHFSRSLKGKGFHHELKYEIEIPNHVDIHSECTIDITQFLSESLYVDANQFDNIVTAEIINIEKPSFLAKQYYYRAKFKISQLVSEGKKIKFSYPIHFRYQKSLKDIEYVKVFVNQIDKFQINCKENSFLLKQLKNQQMFNLMPVGKLEHHKQISFCTSVITLIIGLFIAKNIRNSNIESQ